LAERRQVINAHLPSLPLYAGFNELMLGPQLVMRLLMADRFNPGRSEKIKAASTLTNAEVALRRTAPPVSVW
jgi:hypothetical protein